MKSGVKRQWPIIATVLLVASAIGASGIIIQMARATPTDKTAVSLVVAAIALTGVLITASVALAGHLFRQAIDLRTLRLAEDNAKRSEVDQQRLQMQTAMETVRALASADGRPAPIAQSSAALIVLSKLGENALALTLAAELWPKGQLTPSAAAILCDEAIRAGTPELHQAAAVLILNNWRRLRSGQGQVEWPSSLLSWPEGIRRDAQQVIVKALEEWIAEWPADRDTDFRQALVQAFYSSTISASRPSQLQ